MRDSNGEQLIELLTYQNKLSTFKLRAVILVGIIVALSFILGKAEMNVLESNLNRNTSKIISKIPLKFDTDLVSKLITAIPSLVLSKINKYRTSSSSSITTPDPSLVTKDNPVVVLQGSTSHKIPIIVGFKNEKEVLRYDPSKLKTKQNLAKFVDKVGALYKLPDYHMSTMARIESNFSPKAEYINPKTKVASYGGAKGMYQYIATTARNVGLIKKVGFLKRDEIDNRFNPVLSTNYAAIDASNFVTILSSRGHDAIAHPYLLYVCHNQGKGGCLDILRVRDGKLPVYAKSSTLYYHILKNTAGKHRRIVVSKGRPCTRKEGGKKVKSYCGKIDQVIAKVYLDFFIKKYDRMKAQVYAKYYNNNQSGSKSTPTQTPAERTKWEMKRIGNRRCGFPDSPKCSDLI